MNSGTASVRVGNRSSLWAAGSLFFVNPYEVHMGASVDHLLEYEVFYLPVALILEATGSSARPPHLPRFSQSVSHDTEVVNELLAILRSSSGGKTPRAPGDVASASMEERLIGFFRGHPQLFNAPADQQKAATVDRACRILQERLDGSIQLNDLASQVGVSRYHFIRVFRRATGLVPSAYLRQLRLGKARSLICEGSSPGYAAAAAGFADQAHLTREFQRIFGTTPGKLARLLSANN
jgi:AraC-like DNA-binding protein